MTVSRMAPHDAQLSIEHRYSKKFIDKYIDQEIRNIPDMEAKVQDGITRLSAWMQQDYYLSKNARLAQLIGLDIETIVRKLFVGTAYCQVPELFTSVSAKMAGVLGFNDKQDSITTTAEMLAVLCQTDAFDIMKVDRSASLVIQSQIPLSEELLEFIARSRYLPPMLCKPEDLTNNSQSPYLTHNDSLVLGKGNHHSEDICLDVINRQNQIPLSLDLDFLSIVEEEQSKPPTIEKIIQEARDRGDYMSETMAEIELHDRLNLWHTFKVRSYETYYMLAHQGNEFFLTNKVDKRGRLYSQGYFVTLQGSGQKKAMLEYTEKEHVTGVPAQ